MKRMYGNKLHILIFLLPALLLFCGILIAPIGASFYYSLFDWNGMSAHKTFVGFAYYKEVFTSIDIGFFKALRHSLLLACLGIWVMMFGGLEANPLGIALALLSSVAYSAYLIIADKSGVRELNGFKISFYNTLFGSIFLLVFGHIFGFSFAECRPAGWFWLFLTGLMVVCIGNVMTPEAIKRIGPTVTGILGILEPITSLVCSILLLGEPLTKRSLLGGILVLVSAFLITLGDHKKSSAKESDQ